MKKRGIVFAFWLIGFASFLCGGEQEALEHFYRIPIIPGRFNDGLLEEAVIDFTNQTRMGHHLSSCRFDSLLRENAREHSREMVKLGYFSHQSPLSKNETLKKRLENAGVDSIRAAGENLGVDYVLEIAGVSYYPHSSGAKLVNAKTGKTISTQTYEQFAKGMVGDWLKSPRHCDNILDGRFTRIGVGAALGKMNGLDAIYVTQLFTASDTCGMHPLP
jgi:uncharacterized protein YkwD